MSTTTISDTPNEPAQADEAQAPVERTPPEAEAGRALGERAPPEAEAAQAPGERAPPEADEASLSYERVEDEVWALPDEEVGRVTAYVPDVVAITLGAQPNVEAHIDEIALLHDFDVDRLRKLPDYARALLHVYLLTIPSSELATRVQTLLAEATPLRERMLVAAEGLALLGFVDPERVSAIRRGTGHLDKANDLIALSQLFQAGGAELLAKTRLDPADVERAYDLGMQLVDALGKQRVGTDGRRQAREYEEATARLFRLVVRTYDQGRRALTYLRWGKGDVNVLMPSLFTRRSRGQGSGGGGEAPSDGGSGGLDPVE
ncbi:MAG TPA: hypothetical protein VFS43_34530 [Polyangiaceae bacterium]|nr:hypothetical protein [Polyangiaceae bacterium]